MALYSKSITGLINGVSRQPYAMRLESQGQEQTNCLSSVSKGVRRRPGMQLVKYYTPPTGISLDAWHWIDRSATERFLVHIENGTTNIRVIDLINGTTYTPTGADSYIDADPDDLRFLTIGDVTYIVNASLVPAMSSTRSANPTPFAFVWVKAAIASCAYKINLKRAGATAVSAEYTSPAATSSASTTATIAAALGDTAQTNPDASGFTLTAVGSSLVVVTPSQLTPSISVTFAASGKTITAASGFIAAGFSAGDTVTISGTTSNNGTFTIESVTDTVLTVRETLVNEGPVSATFTFYPDFTISTSDGWGDQALVAVKTKSKVQSFSALPPVGVDGMILEVEGDPETSIDSYFVKFVASGAGAKTTTVNGVTKDTGAGVWEETVKWDTPTTIDPTNMPRKLTWSGSAWALSSVTWGTRDVGDTTTAPDPSFIGVEIEDVAFFKNRLAFISGESVTFSGVGEYEAFFPTTVTTLADDDAFDVTANFPDVAKLKYAIPFNEFLVLFAESGIFGVRGSQDTGLTPKSVEFLRLTSFTGKPGARPVFAGDRIFFSEEANERIIVREFFPVDADGTFTVESISEHVGDYISTAYPGGMAADPVTGMLVLVGAAGYPQAWIYQWFLSNREKVQSAWHSWSFTGKREPDPLSAYCISTAIIRGDVYFVTYLVGSLGSNSWEIVKVPTDPDSLNGSTALGTYSDTNHGVPYLDYWQNVIGTSSGGNTIFDVSGPLSYYYETGGSIGDNIVALAYGSTGWTSGQRGTQITGFTVSQPTAGTTRLTFSGTDYVGRRLIIGLGYYSGYDFSPPLQKNQNTPQLSGRYFARRWKARFTRPVSVTGHRTVGESNTFETTHDRTLDFTQKSVVEFPLHREITASLQTGIYSDHPTQDFELFGVEWEIEWMPRARPA